MQQTTRLIYVYSAVLVLYRTGSVGGYSYQTEPLFRSYADLEAASALGRRSAGAEEVYAVRCEEDSMEVVVRAPPNEFGFFEESAPPRLGLSGARDHCAARPSASGDYVIRVPLSACGSSLTFTKSAVLFSNLLLLPLPSSIWDVKEAAIPVLCQYKRKYTVSSGELRPTWTPHISVQSAYLQLDFRLRLMTSDWSSEKKFPVYFTGETVHMEASVDHYRPSLRLYVGSCVATLTPDVNSHPRYPFIDHRGCFVDSLLSGSRSRFLPRVQDQLLHIQLQPFLFHEDHRHNMYITCYLEASVVSEEEPENRACSFISGRWRSVDGDDDACESCSSTAEYGHKRAQRSQRGHAHETTVGPIVFLPEHDDYENE
ncbi:zona pellucida sperm-binding protein 3 [Oryzias melastigma]|uniref:zona pellucida sperm-binding protein 3 n=1 Tax=Oryzias melastigma TaxID=30732 RepID=UPI000CF7DF43|nr:zona pellucida sperm-binding protein 3 [Oryzias melastigma]